MDPGNFATNLEGGAKLGLTLLWVVIASNLMAMLVQSLAAKLGIATGHNLAELCRQRYRPAVVYGLWGVMEVVAMATDLAEFLGAALGFHLLLGVPMWLAAVLTAVVTFGVLLLERLGFRPLEVVITVLVGVIALCYVIVLAMRFPPVGELVQAAVVPRLPSREAAYIAVAMLGATVMPHVIFLHSALTQGRVVTRKPKQLRRLVRYEIVDVAVAMSVAGCVNAAMLIMAAQTFFPHAGDDAGSIEHAYKTLTPLLGSAAATLFALSLLASGLSSSAVGTMAGQTIMQGFLRRRIPVWLRRLITMAPAVTIILLGADPTRSLVFSQVVLSFGLPFALVPLILFTRSREIMGTLVNGRATSVTAAVVTGFIVLLNVWLLWETATSH
jgi:manganese transport protein